MLETLRVIARFRAQPGKEKALRQVLSGLVDPTRGEDGCIVYELLSNIDEPGEFTFVEEWRNEEALAAHSQSEHIRAARTKYVELLNGAPDLRRYRCIVGAAEGATS